MRQRKYAQALKRYQVRVARRRARIKRLIGSSAPLSFCSGPAPAGELLATITLPSDWMGDTRKSGTWSGAINEGVINV